MREPATGRPLSEIIKKMACTLLKRPKAVPSTEAAHAALLLAHVAWNQTVSIEAPRPNYRQMLREFESSNPNLWDELTSSDAEVLVNELTTYKRTHYQHDRRQVVVCGMRGDNVHVEWTDPLQNRGAMARAWVYNPHAGGVKIPPTVRLRTERRIHAHAAAHYSGKYTGLDVRFRGALCYVDAYVESDGVPLHLCRLRYFGDEEAWSMAFYTYSHEKYEPSVFDNGSFHGTPEEAFDTAAVYLTS